MSAAVQQRRAWRAAALGLMLVAAIGVPTGAWAADIGDDVARAANWLSGEWNDNEQVWQQRIDAADPKVLQKQDAVAHVHTILKPVQVPGVDGRLLYVQQSKGDDLQQVLQQRLLHLRAGDTPGTVRVDQWRLPGDAARFIGGHRDPAVWTTLAVADLQAANPGADGCALKLSFDAASQTYSGSTVPGDCTDSRLRPGRMLQQSDAWRLSENQWSTLAQWRSADGRLVQGNTTDTAMRSRKARYFDGWIWFRNAGPDAPAGDTDTSFMAKVRLHAEGQRIVLKRKDGSETPWLVELATLTYQNTRRPVLKLGLVDRASGKTLSYAWTSVGAEMVGMNLSWFQAGMTVKDSQPEFGF